ncbi:MAG: hypothetical protein VKJ31_02655, partial [Synechococcus sp.]|nr:hypothetical protein [Synechococcus sp.]
MKARLALLLGGALAVATPLAVKAETVQLFQVNTAQPGVMDFKGLGTATYSNSTGTSNSINLGSTTNLGINANVATSTEYAGTASANLSLTGPPGANAQGTAQTGSNFMQTIGSATGAANMQAAASATANQAHTTADATAETQTQSVLGSSHGTYTQKFNAERASLASDLKITLDANGDVTSYTTGAAGEDVDSAVNIAAGEAALGKAMGDAGVVGNTTAEGKLEAYSAAGWEQAYNATYQDKYEDTYSEAYSTAATQQSSLNTTSNATGKVVGSFNTTNEGTGTISFTAADIATLATNAASGTNGSSFSESGTSTATVGANETVIVGGETLAEGQNYTVNGNGQTQDEWEESYSNDYNAAVTTLTTGGSNSSKSDVNVEGIGNIANVGVQSTTNFAVNVGARIPDTVAAENGTGSGGAGMSLS